MLKPNLPQYAVWQASVLPKLLKSSLPFLNIHHLGTVKTLLRAWQSTPAVYKGALLFVALTASFAWSDRSELRHAMDLASTTIFACCGALVAIRHRPVSTVLVPWIALLAGLLTAVGGGTIRCALLSQAPFWLMQVDYLVAGLLGVLGCLAINAYLSRYCGDSWNMADCCALGIFVPLGVEQAQMVTDLAGVDLFVLAIACGAVTGAGGGLLRDLLFRRPPAAFCTTYGLAALFGAALCILLHDLDVPGAWILSGVSTALTAYLTRHIELNVVSLASMKHREH